MGSEEKYGGSREAMRGSWGVANLPPHLSERAADEDGWMHTGDLAVIDAEGYCAIVGRSKDAIIRGGENIAPREAASQKIRPIFLLIVSLLRFVDSRNQGDSLWT